jgi:hypothetical protein
MSSRALVPIGTIAGAALVVAAVVLATGFVAVSDDDFSRVVIAQRFVAAPKLDPSGSSWLPLPFLVLGSVMSLFGRGLAVARVVAVVEYVAALLLLYRAAKNLELSERAAIASAVIGAALPTAARLGVSFQPEALTAGLVVFGASTLTKTGRERVLGGIALGAATLCRYEAWPAALVFAIYCAIDVVRASSTTAGGSERFETNPARAVTPLLAAAAVLALTPACIWMLHGVLAHGSAFFFFQRVSSYRRALGEAEPRIFSLFAYPRALLYGEPELLVAGFFLHTVVFRYDRAQRARFARPSTLPAAILLFLVAGRFVGGAPTHHDERPLLPIFWSLAIFVAWCLFDSPRVAPLLGASRSDRLRHTAAFIAALAGIGLMFRMMRKPESFAHRTTELAIGDSAKQRLTSSDRLLVETGDYGYFAVIAAFGAPERAEPFDPRDPRDAPAPDVFASPSDLSARLAASRASWFVTPHGAHEATASRVGTMAAKNETFVLFRALP